MRRFLATLTIALALLSSCQRRELRVMDDSLTLDIKLSSTAAYVDPSTIEPPDVLTTTFFNNSDGKAAYTDYLAPGRNPVYVSAGAYDCLTYNFITECNIVEQASERDSIYVHTSQMESSVSSLFTKAVKTRAKYSQDGSEEENYAFLTMPVVRQPEYFWVGRGSYDIPYRYEGGPGVDLAINGDIITCNGKVELTGIHGIENIGSVTMYLTNLAGSIRLWSGEPRAEAVAICFSAEVVPGEESLTAMFTTYGKLSEPAAQEVVAQRLRAMKTKAQSDLSFEFGNDLYIIVTDTGGGQYLFTFNVTEQVQKAISMELNINIELEGDEEIVIPEPEHGGGGFTPGIEDWENELIPVVI